MIALLIFTCIFFLCNLLGNLVPDSFLLTDVVLDILIILIISVFYTILRSKGNKREKKLQESIDKLDNVLYTSDQAYWSWDFIDDKIIFSDRAFEMLDYEREVWNQNEAGFYTMVHLSDLPILQAKIKKSLDRIQKGKDPQYEVEFRMKCSDGSWKWICSRASLVKTINGDKPRYLLGTLTDISSFKRTEQSLMLRNKQLEHFVYSVSHDLKAPLVTIEGFSAIIVKGTKECSLECEKRTSLIDYASEIRHAAQDLAKSIDSILELSKIGALHINRILVNTKTIINRIITMNQKKIKETNAQIIIKNSPKLYVQEDILISILQNLIDNALKHATINGKQIKIEIEFQKTFRGTTIVVKDNGPGILKNRLEDIFDVYRRFKNEGKGLGLSIVKRGAEFHGGSAWAENNPDGGAIFYVELKGT